MTQQKSKGTSYIIGRSQEYKAMEYFQATHAQYIIRSAGSHTPIDFIAGNGTEVYVVQVKYGKKPKKVNESVLREWSQAFQAIPVVMEKIRGGRWQIHFIDGTDEIE